MENNFDGLYLRLAKHEGKVEKSIEIALSLINRGFPDEDISEICELGIEKIQKLRKEEYHNLNQEETIENVQASGAFIRAAQIATSMLQDDFEVDMIEKTFTAEVIQADNMYTIKWTAELYDAFTGGLYSIE